ncbi:hypothetical protein EV359DRAFT_77940 [Lentinula novae-zelandiae]|nr:hypothetical protein EV359DRAFT_77940 [Lentinula novae-zelandiae]
MSTTKTTPAQWHDLPFEIWVEICRFAGQSLTELAQFQTVESLQQAGEAWSEVGGRVYPLVKTLRLGLLRPTSDAMLLNFRCSTPNIIHYLDRMVNVEKVFMNDAAIGGDILASMAKFAKLQTLSLEWVTITNAVKDMVFDSVDMQHLRLVDIKWDGHKGGGSVIRACRGIRTLCMTWNDEGKEAGGDWDTWTNASCRSLTVIGKAGTLLSKYERQTLLALLRKLEGLRELHVEGVLPRFTEEDTRERSFPESVDKYVGPIEFLNVHRRLPKLKTVTLTNVGLSSNDVNELTIQIQDVTDLKVNVFGSDKETMCRLLSVMSRLRNLEVNFCDDVNDSDESLKSLADMLDFSPPLRSIYVTGDDLFETTVNHNHFRTLKILCPALEVIGIDDRKWRNARGLWSELLPVTAHLLQ